MVYTIQKRKHRPAWWWLRWPLWFNKKTIHRKVMFDWSAKYDLTGQQDNIPGQDNDFDVNKLFGIGYLWNKKDSARFCWNWNQQTERVVLYSYCHVAGMTNSQNVNGPMDFEKLCEIEVNRWYELTLFRGVSWYIFRVCDRGNKLASVSVDAPHKKKWSFPLGLYFGGSRPAPNDITIEIKKP